MKNLTLSNIAKAVQGRLVASNPTEVEAASVEIDSRKVIPGGIFIATKGERVDGHDFIKQVEEKGALGVICEKEPKECEIPYILVEDSFQALKDLAAYYRQQLSIPIICITGSVGKTSTKEFIAGTLAAKYNVCKTQGNFNNEVGMPLTLLSIREEHEIAVVEMGISHFGEMERMADIAKPDTCVITNIGQCHLENLVDRDGVLKAKTAMLDYMNPDGAIFFNGDDDKLETVSPPWNREITHFGMLNTNDIFATDIVNKGLWGSDIIININDAVKRTFPERIKVHVPLPGRHMIYNAMAACGVAMEYSLSEEEIVRGIESVQATEGRSHVVAAPQYTLIDDCYNANPVSMKAAIDLLGMANTRKVAILGDMFELGENEKELHKEVGEYAMTHGMDVLITIGKLSLNMYEGALMTAMSEACEIYTFETNEEAMEKLPEILKKDDSILIKASHGMHFDTIVDFLNK